MSRLALPLPAVAAISLAAFALAGAIAVDRMGGAAFHATLPLCLLAGVCYLLSHLMRAVRLAVIAMPSLGISFRSAVSLHLFVAPWSLLVPFKLDELLRLHELNRIGGSLPRAIVTVLIDRSVDGVVLIGMALYLLAVGRTGAAGLVGLVGFGLTLIALSFFMLPQLLETTQRHIFLYNHSDNAIFVLRRVDRLKQLLEVSRNTIRSAAPFLLVSTLGIWLLELLSIDLLMWGTTDLPDSPGVLVETMLTRADASWRMAWQRGASGPAGWITAVFLLSLLAPWLLAAWIYWSRGRFEPRRARLPQRTGFFIPADGRGS